MARNAQDRQELCRAAHQSGPEDLVYQQKLFDDHKAPLTGACVKDGYAYVSCEDGTAHMYNLVTQSRTRTFGGSDTAGDSAAITSLSTFGDTLCTGSSDNIIRLWDVTDGKLTAELTGHTAGILAVHMDGSELVSAASDGTLRLWNLVTKTEKWSVELTTFGLGHARCVFLHMNVVFVVCGGKDVRTFASADGTPGNIYYQEQSTSLTACTVAGRHVVAGDQNGKVWVWDHNNTTPLSQSVAHDSPVTGLEVQSMMVFSSSESGSAVCTDISTGEVLLSFDHHKQPCSAVAVTPTLDVVTVSRDCSAVVWSWVREPLILRLAAGDFVWFTEFERVGPKWLAKTQRNGKSALDYMQMGHRKTPSTTPKTPKSDRPKSSGGKKKHSSLASTAKRLMMCIQGDPEAHPSTWSQVRVLVWLASLDLVHIGVAFVNDGGIDGHSLFDLKETDFDRMRITDAKDRRTLMNEIRALQRESTMSSRLGDSTGTSPGTSKSRDHSPGRHAITPTSKSGTTRSMGQANSSTTHKPKHGGGGGGQKQKCALVVDDVELNRTILCRILQRQGVLTEQVKDGRDAVNLLKAGSPDRHKFHIVFMDIEMRDMGGLEATQKIRQSGLDRTALPVIGMTGTYSDTLLQNCFAKGMNTLLVRPLNPRNVMDVCVTFGVHKEAFSTTADFSQDVPMSTSDSKASQALTSRGGNESTQQNHVTHLPGQMQFEPTAPNTIQQRPNQLKPLEPSNRGGKSKAQSVGGLPPEVEFLPSTVPITETTTKTARPKAGCGGKCAIM